MAKARRRNRRRLQSGRAWYKVKRRYTRKHGRELYYPGWNPSPGRPQSLCITVYFSAFREGLARAAEQLRRFHDVASQVEECMDREIQRFSHEIYERMSVEPQHNTSAPPIERDDSPRPIVYGRCRNIEPVLIDPDGNSYNNWAQTVDAVRTQFEESRELMERALGTRQNTESADIMREVEAQETLEEKGILPPLEDSMQRWQELIDEYRSEDV